MSYPHVRCRTALRAVGSMSDVGQNLLTYWIPNNYNKTSTRCIRWCLFDLITLCTVLSRNNPPPFGRRYFFQNPWADLNVFMESCQMFLWWCPKAIPDSSGRFWPPPADFQFFFISKKHFFCGILLVKSTILQMIWNLRKSHLINGIFPWMCSYFTPPVLSQTFLGQVEVQGPK